MRKGIIVLKQFSIGGCRVKVASVEPLQVPGALDKAMMMLSPQRRDKTMRYRFDSGKWLSAGAGLLLDDMLREHGLREHDMQYIVGDHGKPALAGLPSLHFNISHSGMLVACAVGDKPVGVDVQTIVNVRRSLVDYTMSKEEIAQLDALPGDEQQRLFFTQLWTIKESYTKATGTGIGHEFPAFRIDDDGTIVPLKPLAPAASFKMVEIPGAVTTVAVLS